MSDQKLETLREHVNSVPYRFKKQCGEEWEKIEDLIDKLEPLIGTANDLKPISTQGVEIVALKVAIEANHLNFKGNPTARVGTRTWFGQRLENIRIAALNIQPSVPDDGDLITLQIIQTLANIAQKTAKTAA
jgi:hypothetical protein